MTVGFEKDFNPPKTLRSILPKAMRQGMMDSLQQETKSWKLDDLETPKAGLNWKGDQAQVFRGLSLSRQPFVFHSLFTDYNNGEPPMNLNTLFDLSSHDHSHLCRRQILGIASDSGICSLHLKPNRGDKRLITITDGRLLCRWSLRRNRLHFRPSHSARGGFRQSRCGLCG